MKLIIKPQERQSLAMVATPAGLEVRIPKSLDPEGERVQAFIATGLGKIEKVKVEGKGRERPFTKAEVRAIIGEWADKLGVSIGRVQFQPMTRKWGSLSSNGNLTLADDVRRLHRPLVEYIIVHELVHVKHEGHGRNFQVAMNLAMPDWQEREQMLVAHMVGHNHFSRKNR
ncbi:MAG: M48 family metallopeptidase, partial [Anaerolineae bacterium]